MVATARSARPDPHETDHDHLRVEQVDIDVDASVDLLRARLTPDLEGRVDLLFVVAGVTNGPDETPADVDRDTFTRLMHTNALSPMRTVEALEGLVSPDGTIAVMSSGQGSVTNNERGGFEIYRASKSALNQLMRSYAARHRDDGRTLLLTAPGWVRTGLGGPHAPLTAEETVPRLVDVIEDRRGRGGLQFVDYQGRTVAW
ncbi:SDR family oxidoreductase [Nocardioides korecus]